MGDFKLFFYGMLANVVVFIAAIIIVAGLFVLLFGSNWGYAYIVVGLAIGIYAQAMRFSFRRQSGHILYQGGNW